MKIAYITTSFGSLSHTFIRREIQELHKLGLDISLFGIRYDSAKELDEEGEKIVKETEYLYPLKIMPLITSNIYFIFNKPGNYFKTFFAALFNEEKNPIQHLKLIYHFFVSTGIAKNIQKKKIQHIHAHFMSVSATIAMYSSQLTSIPFSATAHTGAMLPLKGLIAVKQKIKKTRLICTISNYNKEYLNKIYPCRQKAHVVRCGIDPEDYILKDHTKLNRKNKIELLAVGRFVEVKGFKYLIKAARILKEDDMKFELSIIGYGKLKSKLKKLINTLNLNGFVCLKGPFSQEQIKKEIDKSDIFIIPSAVAPDGETEGIPVVIMEAMAMGIPVIATQHSGIPELVKHKETGITVPEKNPATIAEAIKLIAKDTKTRKICIENAREIISKEFNIKNIAIQKKKLFEENR